MLSRIECSEFNNKSIHFHEGLNIILGDSEASNSIGKTTALKLIDLSFGSSKKEHYKELIKQYGDDLRIYFYHKIDGKEVKFCRSFAKWDSIEYYNNDENNPEYLTKSQFNDFLKMSYRIRDTGLSFRQAVNQATRIWNHGRPNTPLVEYNNKKTEAVKILVRLFNEYAVIEELDKTISKKEDYLKAKKTVAKLEGAPSTKKEYKILCSKLDELEFRKQTLLSDIQHDREYDSLTSEELEYRRARSLLTNKKYLIEDKIARIKLNFISNDIDVNDILYNVNRLFPNVDLKSIEEIQSFHESITQILKKELLSKLDELKKQLVKIDSDIDRLDASNIDFNQDTVNDETAITQLANLMNEISSINSKINSFQIRSDLSSDISILKKDRIEQSSQIFDSLSSSINNCLSSINDDVYGPSYTSPKISFSEVGTYSYEINNDSGTGREYYSYIILDQALAKLSDLPYIIHDTYMFKNIEYEKVGQLLRYYPMEKQSFISIDGVPKDISNYDLVENNAVLKLSSNHYLFNKRWNQE